MGFEGLDQVKLMEEVVKVVVYFHQTLDEKVEDLEDSLEELRDFYENDDEEEQDDYDLDGNKRKIKVLKPLATSNQRLFNDAVSEISKQLSAVNFVSLNLKKELHNLGTERIMANNQNKNIEPKESGLLEKTKNMIMQTQPVKKEKEYTSLNELDDPFKLSQNQIQETENIIKIFDKLIEFHGFNVLLPEETDIAGQRRGLDIEINYFNTRVQGAIMRIIDQANRLEREAERNDAVKVAIAAKQESDRQRNAFGNMQPPQNQ